MYMQNCELHACMYNCELHACMLVQLLATSRQGAVSVDEERQEEVKLKKAAFVGQGRFSHESDAVVGIAPICLPRVR